MKIKTAIVSMMFAPTITMAEFYSGNALHAMLTGTVADQVTAMGYIAGVHDAQTRVVHCTPSTITLGQITDMVKRHLAMNPQQRHETADAIVGLVIAESFPCERTNRGGRTL